MIFKRYDKVTNLHFDSKTKMDFFFDFWKECKIKCSILRNTLFVSPKSFSDFEMSDSVRKMYISILKCLILSAKMMILFMATLKNY